MKKVPVEILEAWAKKMDVKVSGIEKMLDKYEVELTKYDGKFDEIYDYLHEKVLKEELGIKKQLEIDTLDKEDRRLILSVVSQIARQFYGGGLTENQKNYFYQLIKDFKIGEFEESYEFELLGNLFSSEVNRYLYRTIREFIYLGEVDKFEEITEKVISHMNISLNIINEIDKKIIDDINIFGKEILIYKKGTSFSEKKETDVSKLKYSLEKLDILKNDKKTFSNIKIVNENLNKAQIIDTIIEYGLYDVNPDSVLAIASNHAKNEKFNGLVFLDDGIFIMDKYNRTEDMIDDLKEMIDEYEQLEKERLKEIEEEGYQEFKDILIAFKEVAELLNITLEGTYIPYKNIKLLDIEDLENNGIQKITYFNSEGNLTAIKTEFLTDEVKEIIYYFAKINGRISLEADSIMNKFKKELDFRNSEILRIFGTTDVSEVAIQIYNYYEENLRRNESWFSRFSVTGEQVRNIRKFIDNKMYREDICLFCDFALFNKDGQEGMVITDKYIVARDYFEPHEKHRVDFNLIEEISSGKNCIKIRKRSGNIIYINNGSAYNVEYTPILKDVFEIWKECKGK